MSVHDGQCCKADFLDDDLNLFGSKSFFLFLFSDFLALPENPECTVSENIVSGDIWSVTVSCSTRKVYPQARCGFFRKKNVSLVLWLYRFYVCSLLIIDVIPNFLCAGAGEFSSFCSNSLFIFFMKGSPSYRRKGEKNQGNFPAEGSARLWNSAHQIMFPGWFLSSLQAEQLRPCIFFLISEVVGSLCSHSVFLPYLRRLLCQIARMKESCFLNINKQLGYLLQDWCLTVFTFCHLETEERP